MGIMCGWPNKEVRVKKKRGAPLRIYLQTPKDWDGIPDETITWCADKIYEDDICYIRAAKKAGRKGK